MSLAESRLVFADEAEVVVEGSAEEISGRIAEKAVPFIACVTSPGGQMVLVNQEQVVFIDTVERTGRFSQPQSGVSREA